MTGEFPETVTVQGPDLYRIERKNPMGEWVLDARATDLMSASGALQRQMHSYPHAEFRIVEPVPPVKWFVITEYQWEEGGHEEFDTEEAARTHAAIYLGSDHCDVSIIKGWRAD